VVWDSSLQDGADLGVFGQRIAGTLFADRFETEDVCRWSDAIGNSEPC
jgi:hypothetical protein